MICNLRMRQVQTKKLRSSNQIFQIRRISRKTNRIRRQSRSPKINLAIKFINRKRQKILLTTNWMSCLPTSRLTYRSLLMMPCLSKDSWTRLIPKSISEKSVCSSFSWKIFCSHRITKPKIGRIFSFLVFKMNTPFITSQTMVAAA